MNIPDKSTIRRYQKKIVANGDLISYRHKDYDPHKSSDDEARFNIQGQSAFYAASGIECAQAEVPNWEDRLCFEIKPGTEIYAFDLVQYSIDHGNENVFTLSKEDGGYAMPQEFASNLTTTDSVSAILYRSHALQQIGIFGLNLVILPIKNTQLEQDFFISKKE